MRILRRIVVFAMALVWCANARAQFDDPPDISFFHNRFSTFSSFDQWAVASTVDGLLPLIRGVTSDMYSVWGQPFILSTQPIKVKRFGTLLVYESDAGLLYFVDAGALPDLTLLGTASLDIPYYDYSVADSDLYVAMGFEGVWRYDLSDYSNPVFIDSSMLGIHCIQLQVADSSLYVLDDYNGILRYNVTGPGFGEFVSYLYSPLRVRNFHVHGDAVGMTLVGRRNTLLGDFSSTPPRVTDTILSLGLPSRIMAADSFMIIIDPKVRLIERLNLNDLSMARHIFSNPLVNSLYGDFSERDSVKEMLFPNFSGGISRFKLPDIGLDIKAENAFSRSGPITGLVRIDSSFYTAGVGNPLEKFRILGEKRFWREHTFFDGLAGVSGMGKRSDNQRLYVYYVPLRSILALRPSGDTLVTVSQTRVDSLSEITMRVPEYRPEEPELIFSWNGPRLRIHQLPDSNGVSRTLLINVLGNISDVLKLDSMIVIATNKRNLYFYRLLSRFDIDFRSVFSTPVTVSYMRLLKRPGCQTRLILFSGLTMMNVNTDDFTSPFVDETRQIPVPVSNSIVEGENMFTVGTGGISYYRLGTNCSLPEIVTFGGRGGHLIETNGTFLAVSDGSVINMYNISNGVITEVDDEFIPLPSRFSLVNYPNPFNPETVIRYTLPRGADVSLSVYNILGQKVKSLQSGFRVAGEHSVRWDGTLEGGRPAASGVYFYSLTAENLTETNKMVLIR